MSENTTPQAAPLQVSNAAFLQAVFSEQAGNAHVTAFPDPPDKLNGNGGARWAGSRWADCLQAVVAKQNSFYTISIFHPDENGKAVRQKARHYATYAIVIDDVGTGQSAKVSPDRVAALGLPEPSYKLETSPGNEQWGYLLAEPCTNRTLVENLLNQLVTLQLCPDGSDPGMKGVTRYVRLPEGVNNKTKYPEPWRHRMNAWHPERRHRIEDLAAVVQVNPSIEDQRPEAVTAGEDRVKELLGTWPEDPVLSAMIELGMVSNQDGPGRYAVLCPNHSQHTDRVEEPIRYYRKGAGGNEHGGFSCFHGHCVDLPHKDMVKQLVKEYGAQGIPIPEALSAELKTDYGLTITGSLEGLDSGQTEWPDPEPLPQSRPPVPDFNPQMLPEAVRLWVEDISERIQCAPDYAAVGTMVALSSVIGRRVGIRPKQHDDWLVVPNLWGAIVGRPGIMKTPALAEAMRPLHRLEAKAIERYQAELKNYEIECIARDAGMKAQKQKLTTVKKDNKDDTKILDDIKKLMEEQAESRPVCTRFVTNDATVEKMGELLADNPSGLLVFRDELVGWLRNLDKQGQEGSRSFYLEAWDGKSGFTYDRIGRGTTRIESACVSVLGGIQPGPFSQYVRDADTTGAGADGLLQRIQMLVYPDEPSSWTNIDRYPNTKAKNDTFERFQHLANLDPMGIQADMSDSIPFLRFSDAAQEIFTEWHTQLETVKLRADEPEIIESHLSKYRSLVPSLALICHLTNGDTGPVAMNAMLQAAAWADYLEAHARRIYSMAMDDNATLCALAARVKSGNVTDGFTARDVYQKHWKHLDRNSTQRAIDGLEMLGWLRVEEIKTGGRPTIRCWVNPNVVAVR